LRLVDLAMRVQAAERIIASRTQHDNLVAWFECKGIIDFDCGYLRIVRQIPRPAVMQADRMIGLFSLGFWH
jgi:hypothetical protein